MFQRLFGKRKEFFAELKDTGAKAAKDTGAKAVDMIADLKDTGAKAVKDTSAKAVDAIADLKNTGAKAIDASNGKASASSQAAAPAGVALVKDAENGKADQKAGKKASKKPSDKAAKTSQKKEDKKPAPAATAKIAAVAPPKKEEPTEVEFATKFLVVQTSSRRLPGPSLSPFKAMAKQVKTPRR